MNEIIVSNDSGRIEDRNCVPRKSIDQAISEDQQREGNKKAAVNREIPKQRNPDLIPPGGSIDETENCERYPRKHEPLQNASGRLIVAGKAKPSQIFVKRSVAYQGKCICDRAFPGEPDVLMHSDSAN